MDTLRELKLRQWLRLLLLLSRKASFLSSLLSPQMIFVLRRLNILGRRRGRTGVKSTPRCIFRCATTLRTRNRFSALSMPFSTRLIPNDFISRMVPLVTPNFVKFLVVPCVRRGRSFPTLAETRKRSTIFARTFALSSTNIFLQRRTRINCLVWLQLLNPAKSAVKPSVLAFELSIVLDISCLVLAMAAWNMICGRTTKL